MAVADSGAAIPPAGIPGNAATMTRRIMVFFDGESPAPQQEAFRCCPLGMQFYSPTPHDTGSFIQIDFQRPAQGSAGSPLRCEGLIVCCERESSTSHYRHWVYFLEVPEALRQQLHCFSDELESRCPWCENF